MLGRICKAFNSVCGGNIGPHDGYEGPLMLAGVKPMALLPVFEEDDVLLDSSLHVMKDNCTQLTEAVDNGRLISKDVIFPPGSHFNPSDKNNILRIFAQPELADDLDHFAKEYQLYVDSDDPEYDQWDLPKDIGEYLGYSEQDIALWQRGAQTWFEKAVSEMNDDWLSDARELMRWTRAKEMLSSAWDGAVYNQGPVDPTIKTNLGTNL